MTKWYVASISPPKPSVHWQEPFAWCCSMLPMMDWGYQGEGVFEFKNERDYLWFMLKWT